MGHWVAAGEGLITQDTGVNARLNGHQTIVLIFCPIRKKCNKFKGNLCFQPMIRKIYGFEILHK